MRNFILWFSILFLFASKVLNAQGLYLQDVNGRPIKANNYQEISGTPYLDNTWLRATVVLKSNKIFQDVPIRYNIYTRELIFQGKNQESLVFDQPVSSFSILSNKNDLILFKNGFVFGSDLRVDDFVQVLVDGKVKVVLKYGKSIKESREYNSAITNREFVTEKKYYLINEDGLLHLMPRNKKDLLKLLNNKTDELSSYFTKKGINLKSDDDIIAVINYYNNL